MVFLDFLFVINKQNKKKCTFAKNLSISKSNHIGFILEDK